MHEPIIVAMRSMEGLVTGLYLCETRQDVVYLTAETLAAQDGVENAWCFAPEHAKYIEGEVSV